MHGSYDYGLWGMVLINVAIFGVFVLSYLKPKGKYEWRSMGVFSAFVVALFVEMYGFPLTIYFLLSIFGSKVGLDDPFLHVNGHLLGSLFGAPAWVKWLICLGGSFIMLSGLIIMGKAWKQIHAGRGQLITDGVYARVRHPQYSGLFLITVGMLIQWPTLLTLIMWPILMFSYYRLAMREEKEMERYFGREYREYKSKTPSFVPGLS